MGHTPHPARAYCNCHCAGRRAKPSVATATDHDLLAQLGPVVRGRDDQVVEHLAHHLLHVRRVHQLVDELERALRQPGITHPSRIIHPEPPDRTRPRARRRTTRRGARAGGGARGGPEAGPSRRTRRFAGERGGERSRGAATMGETPLPTRCPAVMDDDRPPLVTPPLNRAARRENDFAPSRRDPFCHHRPIAPASRERPRAVVAASRGVSSDRLPCSCFSPWRSESRPGPCT